MVPYTSLKYSRGKYLTVLPNFTQKQLIKFSWSNFQSHFASVMNVKFRGRNVSQPCADPQNPRKFSISKNLGYTVTTSVMSHNIDLALEYLLCNFALTFQ